jgi:putative ABC transport system permease protein
MFDKDVWQEIFATIRKNKLRTFLTGFSVAWGIFMLIVLLGSGNGLQNAVKKGFTSSSVNIMWLWTGETSMPYKGLKEGRRIIFRNDDYKFLTEKEDGIDKVSSRFFLEENVIYSYKNEYGKYTTSACYPALKDIEKIIVNSGRFINDLDVIDLRKVIVIGENIRMTLFKDEDPMGKYLRLNNVLFKVVGLFHDERGDYNRTAYIPFTTTQRIFNGGDRVHTFSLTTKMVKSAAESDSITEKVRRDLALRHQFDPKDKRAMGSFNMLAEYLRTMKIFEAIKIFIWIVGIGTLIAGIVGVSNIMLILVKERTREIGIRKALGATPASVTGLILLESILITTIAGYIGLVLGTGIMEAVNWALERTSETGGNIFLRNPTVDFTTAIVSTVLLIAAGSLAGYLPARKAATVKPVEALRDE